MKKFAFIGAGSYIFTRNLVRDLLTFPAFEDCHIALMDINPLRLEKITACVNKINNAFGNKATVTSTMNRAEALEGADGVLCTVFNGDIDIWRYDIEIPKEYGVDINIGDTRSVSGIFRALRNIPLMLDICHDIEKYCPKAVFLNYTNPMSMLCKAMQSNTKVEVTGLCHSVQGTAKMLAEWIGAKPEEMTYTCAGVNHQAFYIDLRYHGEDAYPLIRKALEKPEIWNVEQVRNEMFRQLDYYPTESSGHNSEYNAWFRKRPDLIEKYCTHGTGWNPGEYAFSLNGRIAREKTWVGELDKWIAEEKVDTACSGEYASNIFNARFGDGKLFKFNGNVLNRCLIDNLPENSCVEVPVLASEYGMEPIHVGPLPDHLAILVNTTARLEDMVAEAAVTGDKRKVFHAVCMDPLCSAVCSLEEIKQMTDALFEKNKDYLPAFQK
ncbi:MAG: alpha-galactosidase [Eubacteriales bacterium]|nr:alpha-galactosidase [Eubacteriales bacterium]